MVDLEGFLELLEIAEKTLNILVLVLILKKELKDRKRESKSGGKRNRKR